MSKKKALSSFSKKKAAYCTALLVAFLSLNGKAGAQSEILFNAHILAGYVFSSNYEAFPVKTGYGLGSRISLRTPFLLELSAGFDYMILPRETVTDEKLSSADILRSGVGAGFYIPLTERFALFPSVDIGVYNLGVSGQSKTSLSFDAKLAFIYKFSPRMSLELPVAVSFNRGVFSDVTVQPGVTLNISKMFTDEAKIEMQVKEVKPVFPVLYSWYEKNSFATVTFKNLEEAGITGVSVSFYQSQYMTQPKVCAAFDRIETEESFDVNLLAFFNETLLDLIEKTDVKGSVTISYSLLGQKKEKSFTIKIGVWGRNSMSWEDDRRAAVFVSSKDPAAMLFSRHIMSGVRTTFRPGVPLNIQYAMAIFESLDLFGINYVIDPNSAYADNVGSASIDFLQFPYQTLMYRGGDCDDLSILTCSLFESIGVHTAFITVPGHIFMAFDSGVKLNDAWKYFHNLDDYIVSDGEIWVPLEITVGDEGYTKAWRIGSREWRSAAKTGDAMLYKMNESWELYRPVSIASAKAKFELPEKDNVYTKFNHSINEWIRKEIAPRVKLYNLRLSRKEDARLRNDFGILYVRYGLFDEAEEQFNRAIAMDYEYAALNTAGMYYVMEQYESASLLYQLVIESDPKNLLAYLGLARSSYELGDYNICDKCYTVLMASDESLASQYSYLSSFELSKGRAFSLAERIDKTIWIESDTEVVGNYPDAIPYDSIKDENLKHKRLSDNFIQRAIENSIKAYQNSQKEEKEEIILVREESQPVKAEKTYSSADLQAEAAAEKESIPELSLITGEESQKEEERVVSRGAEGKAQIILLAAAFGLLSLIVIIVIRKKRRG